MLWLSAVSRVIVPSFASLKRLWSIVIMPSFPLEAIIESIWYVFGSRTRLRMAVFATMISNTGTEDPSTAGTSCWLTMAAPWSAVLL